MTKMSVFCAQLSMLVHKFIFTNWSLDEKRERQGKKEKSGINILSNAKKQ